MAKKLLLTLAAGIALTLVVIELLQQRTHRTMVELAVRSEYIAFTLLLPQLSSSPHQNGSAQIPAIDRVQLLAPGFAANDIELWGNLELETTLADTEGPIRLRPLGKENGVIKLFTPGKPHPENILHPSLDFGQPTRVTLRTSGRTQSGQQKIEIFLEPTESELPAESCGVKVISEPRSIGRVEHEAQISVALTDVQVIPRTGSPIMAGDGSVHIIRKKATETAITATGPGTVAVGLTLPARTEPCAQLSLLRPSTGRITQGPCLPLRITNRILLPWRDRLAVLEPVAGEADRLSLLWPNLHIEQPNFFRPEKSEIDNYLESGDIRYLSGDRPPLSLKSSFLLSLEAEEPLTLRSLTLTHDKFAIVLLGRLSSLRLGPTVDLQAEQLQSLFVWAYTHKLRTFIYATVAWVAGLIVTAFKLFYATPSKEK